MWVVLGAVESPRSASPRAGAQRWPGAAGAPPGLARRRRAAPRARPRPGAGARAQLKMKLRAVLTSSSRRPASGHEGAERAECLAEGAPGHDVDPSRHAAQLRAAAPRAPSVPVPWASSSSTMAPWRRAGPPSRQAAPRRRPCCRRRRSRAARGDRGRPRRAARSRARRGRRGGRRAPRRATAGSRR